MAPHQLWRFDRPRRPDGERAGFARRQAGDRVAAQTEKSVPALVLYLATVRAGAVYLPLNTAYTLNELDYFISDAEPSLVVCDPSKAEASARSRRR
jgi:acyl-coenzyme A synthetase/AMP-(fatty) acid ligase